MYLMPYAPSAYGERNVSDSLDEHVLVVGSLDGLKLGRPHLPMMLLCERPPCDDYIATGVDERWYRSSSIRDAFVKLKEMLICAPILGMPTDAGKFYLDCDASDRGLGAVLSQDQSGAEVVIAYASRTLYVGNQL